MSKSTTDESWKRYSMALGRLLSRPDLMSRFQQDLDGSGAGAELGIPRDMQQDLKQILLKVAEHQAAVYDNGTQGERFGEHALTAQRFYEATYRHLRRGAVVTTMMSVLVFVMGLLLLGIAAAEALTDENQGGTVALAASGIVAIAAAFYQSPVIQMRASAAQVQRASMVLMSYMLGMSLLSRSLDGEDTTAERDILINLTSGLVDLLPP